MEKSSKQVSWIAKKIFSAVWKNTNKKQLNKLQNSVNQTGPSVWIA